MIAASVEVTAGSCLLGTQRVDQQPDRDPPVMRQGGGRPVWARTSLSVAVCRGEPGSGGYLVRTVSMMYTVAFAV
jgi:hypothetical protein